MRVYAREIGGELVYDLQKASMWKRISAALCDLILMAVAAAGFAERRKDIINGKLDFISSSVCYISN